TGPPSGSGITTSFREKAAGSCMWRRQNDKRASSLPRSGRDARQGGGTRERGPAPPMTSPLSNVLRTAQRMDGTRVAARILPKEAAVALSYGGTTHAVMMATPDDLEDFALGFSLTEGIISSPDEIETI